MKHLGIILVVVLASILRLYSISTLPPSMSDDEIRETESAYAIATTGKSLTGKFLPPTFTLDGFAFAPVPIYASAIVLKILPLSEFSARLSYAIVGIGTVYLLYLVTKKLFARHPNANDIALLSALTLALTPWHIHISRFAHEGVFPPFLYLLGTWLLFKATQKSSLLPVLSALSFFLGFYSYAATKIVYLPVVIIVWWFCRKHLSKQSFFRYWILVIVTVASFVYLAAYHQGAAYSGGRIFLEDIQTANLEVNAIRTSTAKPELLARLLHNKFTYWGRMFLEKYSYAFSGQFLFTDGEAAGLYSLPNRGQLYLAALPFLLLGILYLFSNNRRVFWLVLSMLLIAPLPSGLGVSRPTYTHRSVMMLPWLSILTAYGLWHTMTLWRNIRTRIATGGAIVVIFLYALGSYLQQYYFEWPRYGGSYFSQPTKEMIQKAASASTNVVITGDAPNLVLHYLFYTRTAPNSIPGSLSDFPITIDTVRFDIPCKKPESTYVPEARNTRHIMHVSCSPDQPPDDIITDINGQVLWHIYEPT